MEDPSAWGRIANWLWGVLVPVGAYVWNKQDDRIKQIEVKMYSKDEAHERRDSVDATLKARREDILALHAKVDAKYEKLDDKIEVLARDMHQGFSDIKDLLLRK